MKVPLVVYLGAASQVVPMAAAALARQSLRGPRAWVLVWCGILACGDALSLALGERHQTNLFVINLVTPVGGAVALWALASWHEGEVPRLTLRLAIVPFVLAWLVLTIAFDESDSFSRVADPMASLVGLGAAAFTLLARSRRAEGLLHRHDWFWITGGMALCFGAASALAPLSSLLVGSAPELMNRAYEIKSVLDVFAFLAIARGVTCPAET